MKKFPFKSASIDVEKKINLEKGIIPFILTSKTVDRDSEVILPDGGDVEEFKTNPVFLWAHDIWSPSIGKVLTKTMNINHLRMSADVQFDLDDPFAALIFNKYAKGHLNAGSIRFRPTQVSPDPVMKGQKGVTIEKWKLLEFSAVPVPANPQALAQIQKGFEEIDDHRVKEWGKQLSEMEPSNAAKEITEENLNLVDLYIKMINTGKGDDAPEQKQGRLTRDEPIPFQATFDANGNEVSQTSSSNPTADIKYVQVEEDTFKLTDHVMDQIEASVLAGIQKAMNPLLMDEFKYVDKDGEPQWVLLANAMINLFHNKTLPDYQKKYVYDHLAANYKKFDRKPPAFEEQPDPQPDPDPNPPEENIVISNESIEKIIDSVKEKMKE